jgi:RNA polymerase sigma factor (sigma-70 family)
MKPSVPAVPAPRPAPEPASIDPAICVDWNDLCTRLRPSLRLYARKLARSEEDAQDIAQTAWKQLLQRVRSRPWDVLGRMPGADVGLEAAPDLAARVLAWLYKAVRHVTRDQMKRRALLQVESDDEAVRRFPAPRRNVVEELIREEVIGRVRRVLAALPQAEADLITVKHYLRVPVRKIAVDAGVPRETIHRRLGRAMEHFRELYTAELEIEAAGRNAGICRTGSVSEDTRGVPCPHICPPPAAEMIGPSSRPGSICSPLHGGTRRKRGKPTSGLSRTSRSPAARRRRRRSATT